MSNDTTGGPDDPLSQAGDHHPSTYKAVRTGSQDVAWDDHAVIHRKSEGEGLFNALKGLHRGTLAQMVAMIASMPETERGDFVIEKAGDHRLETPEIMALAQHADFPGRR